MATIVTATVAVELIAALVLVAQPGFFAELIFGLRADDAVRMMGRCYGVALLALVIAWWPDRTAPASQRFFFRGRLVYNALIALYLSILRLLCRFPACSYGPR